MPILLPTTVVGSYSVPEWLERLKTDFYRKRLSAAHLADVHDVAVKAAIKDQELAGIDIVSDGELRRDNDVDYLLARMPGVRATTTVKSYYFDYYDLVVATPLTEQPVGLAEDFRFTREHTDKPIKFSFTGPFSLSRRVRDEVYGDRAELVRALARALNAEARDLVGAGATMLQIDEPFLAGYPEQVALAVEAINIVTAGVEATWGLHVCYGNRYARPSWEGHYSFLFPTVLEARVDQLILEFARKGDEDLPAIAELGWDRALGLGVLDVKSEDVESRDQVAMRISRALEVIDADKLIVNPDCGLRHVSPPVARAKLRAMVEGAAMVRNRLLGRSEELVSAGDPAN
jgi:5-methyltetrahydropteroyltriglutamate--homocysteine methyltransferase